MNPLAAAIAAAAADAPVIHIKGPGFVPGRYVLVDGDYLIYGTAGNNETSIGDARMRLMQKLQDFKAMSGAEHIVLHLTATGGHKGHRYVASTIKPYQGNRSGSSRPKNWELLRDFCESYKGVVFRQKLWGTREADDGIALHVRLLHEQGNEAVVAMKDKDSQMFTGCTHMDWDTFELCHVPRGTYEKENSVGLIFGHKWFWLQMLAGDTADHIPGVQQIRGVTKMVQCGMGRAKEALCMSHDNDSAQATVAKAYIQFYKENWADAFAENACLLWMRDDREADPIDFLKIIQPDAFGTSEIEAAAKRLALRIKEACDAAANP